MHCTEPPRPATRQRLALQLFRREGLRHGITQTLKTGKVPACCQGTSTCTSWPTMPWCLLHQPRDEQAKASASGCVSDGLQRPKRA